VQMFRMETRFKLDDNGEKIQIGTKLSDDEFLERAKIYDWPCIRWEHNGELPQIDKYQSEIDSRYALQRYMTFVAKQQYGRTRRFVDKGRNTSR